MFSTRLTERLGLQYPIVSAPMAQMSGGDLAGAVSKAGGLGTFGAVLPKAAPIPISYIKENLAKIRAVTDRPFGVGFITQYIEGSPENFDFVLSEGVRVILLSFADPRPWLGRIKAKGCTAICQAQTMEAAHIAVAEGADVLAVQGNESGGHCGALNLLPFLSQALDTFPEMPIIAAGGIANGRSLAAVLAAGAEGAWIGTGFRSVKECAEISEEERTAIVESDGRNTVRSSVYDIIGHRVDGNPPWPEGIALRTRRNRFLENWVGRESELVTQTSDTPDDFKGVWDDPRADVFPHLFGEAAGFVSNIETAEAFMIRIAGEAEQLLNKRLSSGTPS